MSEGSDGSSADQPTDRPSIAPGISDDDDSSDDVVLDTSATRQSMAARLHASAESVPTISAETSLEGRENDSMLKNDSILDSVSGEDDEDDGPELVYRDNERILEDLKAAEQKNVDQNLDQGNSDSQEEVSPSSTDVAQLVEKALNLIVGTVASHFAQQLQSPPAEAPAHDDQSGPDTNTSKPDTAEAAVPAGQVETEQQESVPADTAEMEQKDEAPKEGAEPEQQENGNLFETKVHSDAFIWGLFTATERGDLERVRRNIFEDPTLINVMGVNEFASESLLHAAARSGHDEVARFLMRQEVKPQVVQNDVGREPLHEAVIAGDYQMVKSIYDGNVYTPNTRDTFSFTALHYAAVLDGHIGADIVHFLVRMMAFDLECRVGKDCKYVIEDDMKEVQEGETVIHIASRFVKDKTVRWLVELGVDLSKVSALEGRTALHVAIINAGRATSLKSLLHLIKLLLVGGINVDTVDNEGRTGLHYAAAQGLERVVDYLLRDGMANAAVQSQTGMTALLEAARNGHATCVDVLQNFKPTLLDQVCNDGNSVLHHACVSPEHASLQVLLDFKGTDVHILNKEGQTAAQYARAHETESALEAAGKVEEFVKAEEQKIQHAVAARQDKEESAKKIQSFLKKKAAKRDHENSGQHPGFRPQFTPLSSEELFKERYQHKQQPSKSKRATIKEEEKSEDSPADIDSFVQQFHVPASIQPHGRPQVRSPRGLERSDTNTDLASSVKEFVGKFASAGVMDLCCGWRANRQTQTKVGEARRFVGMGFEDMVRLLEALEMMGSVVSRSEVYRIFFRIGDGEGTWMQGGKPQGRELSLAQFQSYMRTFATRADNALLQRLLQNPPDLPQLLAPEGSGFSRADDDDSDTSDEETEAEQVAMAAASMERKQRLAAPRFVKDRVDPRDFLPTMTGVNSPEWERGPKQQQQPRAWASRTAPNSSSSARRTSSAGLATRGSVSAGEGRASRFGRDTPKSLKEALQGFTWCQESRDKIRVSSEDSQWLDGGPSFESKSRGKVERGGNERVSGPDRAGELALMRSTTSIERMEKMQKVLSSDSERKQASSMRNPNGWKAKGCCQSRSAMLVSIGKDGRAGEPTEKVIANLGPWLKHLWPDYSPAVAPMPHLVDAAHDDTYHECLETNDYLGCLEVVSSSLSRVSRAADPELYQRVYAQAAVFCVFYALRSLKAKNPSTAIALLKRADLMTTPGDVEYAGRKSLRGWTMDVMAQYYLERGKANAALHYMRKAMKHIASLPSSEGQAAWRAHLAAILSALHRPREALEVVKEALGGVVGPDHHVLSKTYIKDGKIPHAHRKLAAALCFNLAVSHAQMHAYAPAFTSVRFALLIAQGAPPADIEAAWFVRFQGFADALKPLAKEQAAKARDASGEGPSSRAESRASESRASESRASDRRSRSATPSGPSRQPSRLATAQPGPRSSSRPGASKAAGRPLSQPGGGRRGSGHVNSGPGEVPRPQTTVPGERRTSSGSRGNSVQRSGAEPFPALKGPQRPQTSSPTAAGGVRWLDEG